MGWRAMMRGSCDFYPDCLELVVCSSQRLNNPVVRSSMEIRIEPIGVIRSPFKSIGEIPCQAYKSDKIGEIEVFKQYEQGLKDVEGFSHLIILFIFHKREGYSLFAKPFLDAKKRGVFATRSPARPNHIGVSVVELLERKGNILKVGGIDVLDGTPLLDIKPYVPQFDQREKVKIGWLEGKV
jgi:tRNA-Thr(GGU) m(6)t(6)A37 methyltransferase TsaA